MSTNSEDEQRKHNTTPTSTISESSKLLSRRRKHQAPRKKRRSSPKMTKDEIKYQHFVHDLQRNIQVHMKECLRESGFDTRDNPRSKTDQVLQTILKSKKTPLTIGPHRTNETIVTNQQDSMAFLKYNETKRLAADIQTILAGPEMKTFYTQFIRPVRKQQSISPEDSFFNVSDR